MKESNRVERIQAIVRSKPFLTLFLAGCVTLATLLARYGEGVALLGSLIVAAAAMTLGLEVGKRRARPRRGEEQLLRDQIVAQRRTVDVLADGLDAALFICERKGTVLYANPPARRLFGNAVPSGVSLAAITRSEALERLLAAACDSPDPVRAELTFAYPMEWIGLTSVWRDVDEGRLFVSMYEITELRRLERVRRDFVANVSHELRTSMMIIRGYAETLIDEEPPTETSGRMLPRIVSEVARLATITRDLLALSVAESGGVVKERCDLADVVRGITSGLLQKAADKGLSLSYTGPDALMVVANTTQMSQVALNLVDNAINYTASGSVQVALDCQGDRAVLTVQDTGLGIAPDQQDRVFERFYRVDRGRSRSTGGTGLGLSIVRHIVEAHGGRVGVESVPGLGATFRVEIPIESGV